MSNERYQFTDQQKEEIGAIVTSHWGDHFQTGIDFDWERSGETMPYLYVREGPMADIQQYILHPDGQVDKRVIKLTRN